MDLESTPLRITDLAAGGDGVGRSSDGRVVFVEGGVPGDLVDLAGVRVGKRMARARIGRLLEASADRATPRCRHFGVCGGCRWQHIRYATQLDAKLRIVRDALERIGGIDFTGDVDVLRSPEAYGYRARARLVESSGGLGYRARASHEVVPVEECPILRPEAEARLRALVADQRERADRVATERPPRRASSGRSVEWEILAGSQTSAARRVGRSAEAEAPSSVTIEVLGESLEAGIGSFVQGNALLWDALAAEVRAQCLAPSDDEESDPGSASSEERTFVELFAGIGFLTLPLARAGFRGVAYESDRAAVASLVGNLARSGFASAVEVHAGRVERRRDWDRRLAGADLLVLDPPRSGLDAAIRSEIAKSGPRRLVYVSCDPATLARDLRECVAAGYRLESLCMVDLFPQTPHVEVVARLERLARADARTRRG